MKKLTLVQLDGLEKRAKDFISKYGELLSHEEGPPSPGEVLAMVGEIRAFRNKKLS